MKGKFYTIHYTITFDNISGMLDFPTVERDFLFYGHSEEEAINALKEHHGDCMRMVTINSID